MKPEVSLPTAECPDPQLWNCVDAMSAEAEVLEFLAQLVRTIKPKLIVETGTFKGISAAYIGKALLRNGRGRMITCEVVKDAHEQAKAIGEKANVLSVVEYRLQSSLEVEDAYPIDFLFLDSEPTIRIQELEHFKNMLSPNAVVVIHDVNSGCHNPLRQQVLALEDFDVVMLPTPRGLAICQRRI